MRVQFVGAAGSSSRSGVSCSAGSVGGPSLRLVVPRVHGALANKALELSGRIGGVPGGQPSAGRQGGGRAAGLRSWHPRRTAAGSSAPGRWVAERISSPHVGPLRSSLVLRLVRRRCPSLHVSTLRPLLASRAAAKAISGGPASESEASGGGLGGVGFRSAALGRRGLRSLVPFPPGDRSAPSCLGCPLPNKRLQLTAAPRGGARLRGRRPPASACRVGGRRAILPGGPAAAAEPLIR
jgi:hypothetical protein